MTKQEIYAALTSVFHDVFDDESIVLRDDMTAEDVPNWDSQSHISLILAAEMRFGVNFRTSEIDSLKNVGNFASLIESKLAQAR